MTETQAAYLTSQTNATPACWQCKQPMPVQATPEMCPNCSYVNFATTPGMKPTLAEWEAAGRAYQAALNREDVDAMREADETFWELAARLSGKVN